MNKKVLFTCSTCYQLIVSIQMAITEFSSKEVDCIITDFVPEYDKVVNRLRQMNVFSSTYAIQVKNKKYDGNIEMQFENIFLKSIGEKIASVVRNAHEYEYYLFANCGEFTTRIGRSLKKANPTIKLCMYEDGTAAYCMMTGSRIMAAINPVSHKEKLKKALKMSPLAFLDYYYVIYPELMVWDCPVVVKKIPSINEDNCQAIREILNEVFDYKNIEDTYEEKVIFFEESYVGDGIPVDDVSLVERLRDLYGIENILIKTHPRIPQNRFKSLGYKTNINHSIPWEVIVLNIPNLDDKILVTMTSTALINTFLIRKSNAKLIFSFDSIRNNDNKRIKNTLEVIDRLISLHPDKIMSSLPER
ncbi:MAG: alpha-2,8-polysialyltransferase family protein [Tannerellaceae bacterium]|nr:alpha-2,8-polysialyltransferase family protein [Tannerellaceae bacterium]